MSETFNFNRFVTYFKYDLKQMWRNHSRAAMLMPAVMRSGNSWNESFKELISVFSVISVLH